MGNKLRIVVDGAGVRIGVNFFCPGCEAPHYVTVHGHKNLSGASWGWNGSEDAPTFHPSILSNPNYLPGRCHCFVSDGKIQFLDDCFHSLKGRTVPLPDAKGLL